MTNGHESRGSVNSRGLTMAIIGGRVRAERTRLGLTLEELSARSGCSRSMLSAIERGDKVPTVLILDRIANALGVSVSRLIITETASRVEVIRQGEQRVIEDRHQGEGTPGYRRWVTSPVLEGVDFEMGRLEMDAGVDAGSFSPHAPGWSEYVVVEKGSLAINLDGTGYRLDRGDAIYFASDCEHAYMNVGEGPCIAYIVMTGDQGQGVRPRVLEHVIAANQSPLG